MRAIGAESWLTEPERALLFAIGAYAPGEGRIVEIGSWKGASACLLAGGLARRGQGRLTGVDPHAGGPPWLGLAPFRGTLESFRTTTTGAGVALLLDMRVGDSLAVAGSWPAQPLDAVFIDGDHSLIGALHDFECWAPKLRAVSVDRGDGEVVQLPGAGARRVVVCLADEVEGFGTALQVGDVLLVCNDGGEERSLPIHHSLLGSRLRRLRLAGAAALGRAPAARPVAG